MIDNRLFLECSSELWVSCSIFWNSHVELKNGDEKRAFVRKKYNGSKGNLDLVSSYQIIQKRNHADEFMSLESENSKIDALASLHSPWLPPSGNNCVVVFSAKVQTSLQVAIASSPNANVPTKNLKFNETNSLTDKWSRYRSFIGRTNQNFRLIWSVNVTNNTIFAGFDDIMLENCDASGSKLEPCPITHYRCKETGLCQYLKKVCNFEADCPLGDDEHDCGN